MPATIVVVVGLLLLVNFIVINPLLAGVARELLRLVVVVAAAAAIAGALALVMRQGTIAWGGRGDRAGAIALLVGLGAMLVAGLYPGSSGTADPAMRWLVAALLAPLVAALFALLFVVTLGAVARGMGLRSRQMTVMLLAAAVAIVLLLPIGGAAGTWLSATAGWALAVPIGGVFRGLLIGIAIATAIHAARILLAVDGADE